MNYPIEILPNKSRKLISCDVQSHFLIRSTPTSMVSDLIDETTGDIKQNTICSPTEHITDLSTSLFGVFNVEHNKIELIRESKKKFGAYCSPDSDAVIPIFEIDFIINENRGFWSILIKQIHNESVTYTIGDRPNDKYTAICKVIHTPALWNFWHFSIKWYLNDHNCFLNEIQDEKLRKKIAKRLSGEARAMVAKFAKIVEPNFQELITECYTK